MCDEPARRCVGRPGEEPPGRAGARRLKAAFVIYFPAGKGAAAGAGGGVMQPGSRCQGSPCASRALESGSSGSAKFSHGCEDVGALFDLSSRFLIGLERVSSSGRSLTGCPCAGKTPMFSRLVARGVSRRGRAEGDPPAAPLSSGSPKLQLPGRCRRRTNSLGRTTHPPFVIWLYNGS